MYVLWHDEDSLMVRDEGDRHRETSPKDGIGPVSGMGGTGEDLQGQLVEVSQGYRGVPYRDMTSSTT